jgi:hypothetical protein
MSLANVSFMLLQKYLNITMNLGFIQPNGGSYGLTEEGKEFLLLYKQFQDRNCKVQKEVGDLAEQREILKRLCHTKKVQDNAITQNMKTKIETETRIS